MGMSVGGDGRTKADINMTPMIDVLLVLIIIFMVITPVTPRGLNALVPQPPSGDPGRVAPAHDIVVSVRGDGTLMLNQEVLDAAGLGERLASLFKTGARDVIFVRGDKGIDFGRVAQVIDLARGVGVYRVALMTN